MNEPVLQLEHLTKRYGRKTAVEDLTFAVPGGSIFGFLGLNGAGKSTTIQMILGLIRPTSGRVLLFGKELRRSFLDVTPRLGALLEQPAFVPYLSGRRNLELLAVASAIRDRSRVSRVLDIVQLGEAGDRKFGTYSQGMRQSLGLAAALLREPQLVVLDEPTNGLDPEAIQNFRATIRRLSDEDGTTFFISSHLLHEVEMTCDSVAIIRDGRLVVSGRVEELIEPDHAEIEIRIDDPSRATAVLTDAPEVRAVHGVNGSLRVHAEKAAAAEINARLVRAGLAVSAFTPVRRTLEDFFLESATDEDDADRRDT